jgi:hypothetical protein
MTPIFDILTGRYVPPFEILRIKNIRRLFIVTIHPMDEVIDKYDYCLSRLCSRIPDNKLESMREEIHERTYNLTLKLLE